MTSPELTAAAEAYRAERARYWVRRKKVGETTTPGGSTAILVTQVELEDETVLFSGHDDAAKSWLDQTCLRAAMTRLFREPSPDLVACAGSRGVLTAMADRLLSPAE